MVLTQADIATLKKVGINMLILIGVTITLVIVSILIGI